MADRYLLESGSPDGYLLEDGTGVLSLELNRLWLPTDLGSKLLFWLHASTLSGVDNSNITTWTDQSSNSNNGTGVGSGVEKPKLRTAMGPSGGKAVQLTGGSGNSEYFTLPTTMLSGLSGGTGGALYGLYKQATNPPGASDPGALFGDFGSDAAANHNPFTDNINYDDGLSDTRKTTTVTSTSDWQLLGIRSKTSDWRLSLNAALDGANSATYYSTATNTFGASSAPRIGVSGGTTNFLNALIHNLVGTSDFLTTGEKEQLEGYMAHDAGRADLLPAGHTYKSAAPTVAITSNVTLALTGQSVTAARGSVLASAALALTGGALAAAQGSVAPQASKALSGESVAAAQGSVGPNVTVALTGLSISVAQGSVGLAQPLTGQEASVGQGSVSSNVTVALVGLSVSAAQGALGPANTEVLSGQELSVAQGALAPAISPALSGQSVTVAQGTLVPSSAQPLTGQLVTVAQGSVGPSAAVPLTGQELTAARGTITASSGTSDVTIALTGLSLSVAQGSVAVATDLALSGQQASLSMGSVGPAISRVLTGQSLTVAQGALVVTLSSGQIKVYIGGYTGKPIKVWDGAAWVTKPLKRWDGAAWVTT